MPEYQIRQADAADLAAVLAIVRDADLPPDGIDDQFGDGYAVATADGHVVGVAGIEVHGHDGLLRSAAIVPDWRGRGVGDRLTRDRIEWARRRGLAGLYLLTTTAGDYFPRFGFVTLDRAQAPNAIRDSREFASACPASAAFMYLNLSNGASGDAR